jgi:hypothetical protein
MAPFRQPAKAVPKWGMDQKLTPALVPSGINLRAPFVSHLLTVADANGAPPVVLLFIKHGEGEFHYTFPFTYYETIGMSMEPSFISVIAALSALCLTAVIFIIIAPTRSTAKQKEQYTLWLKINTLSHDEFESYIKSAGISYRASEIFLASFNSVIVDQPWKQQKTYYPDPSNNLRDVWNIINGELYDLIADLRVQLGLPPSPKKMEEIQKIDTVADLLSYAQWLSGEARAGLISDYGRSLETAQTQAPKTQ